MESLSVEKMIKASVPNVFNAIKKGMLFEETGTVPGSLSMNFSEGGDYSFEWRSGGKCFGKFKSIVENRKVEMSWNTIEKNVDCVSDTTVTIELLEVENGTHFKLTHTGLKSGVSFDSHKRGWETSIDDFTNLSSNRN